MSDVCGCSAGGAIGEKKVVVPWKKVAEIALGGVGQRIDTEENTETILE